MLQHAPYRRYILLTPCEPGLTALARFQHECAGTSLHVRVSGALEKPVRALMLAGKADGCAVLDLGRLHPCGSRQAALYREKLPPCAEYHTLLIASDWPDPELLLYAPLGRQSSLPVWQMQQAAAHYLRLPAADQPLSPPPQASERVLHLRP